ncbi:gamma-glutamylcyclotransferase family protein [Ferrimonas gelatinilytica]|uniref:Gamma-glutamylcyclotransferase n=1 Tax=Ferrimonas gelatinilytica TaxID=1255257 RepID=A0ABP9RXG2_9GAMM
MYYYAYGSNMSSRRLAARVAGARRLGALALAGYQLRFHKVGQDGSGKCDAFYTGDPRHRLWGALYWIDDLAKATLDRIEGVGQGYCHRSLLLPGEGAPTAFLYVATRHDFSLQPFDWYQAHVLQGARELGLPLSYQAQIAQTPSVEDPDAERRDRQQAIHRA